MLAYGSVADLLSEVAGEVLARLPDAQRVAVDRVLLRDTSGFPATDQHVVAAAVMSIIRNLSPKAPVVIGIDDLQWLDQCSRAAAQGDIEGAERAALGMTNAEVAAELFISAKTVESNLTQVYRKLDIHLRAELGRVMGNHEADQP